VVKDGVSLTAALDHTLPQLSQAKDKAFVQALCYGVMRWYLQLDFLLSKLTQKPIRDLDVRLLILIGLYQLQYMRVKTYAAVSETVSAVPKKKSWARPLVNAVLRKFVRDQEALMASLEPESSAAFAHPQWLCDFFSANWPEHFEQILVANNQMPPMTLRLNIERCSRDHYMQKLNAQGLASNIHPVSPSALTLEQPVAVERLPGFAKGLVFVQDAAAQLAAELLDVQSGHRVIDICAAPGGKTTHILEQQPQLKSLTAVDIDTNRLQRVAENLQRLQLRAELVAGDARRPEQWWDGRRYDRVLLDAPCSATGVIRRHPDIKMLRKPEDIDSLVKMQEQVLRASWQLLKPGGMLLYATCSVLQKENEKQIKAFVESHDDAEHKPINAQWGRQRQYGRQILTGDHQMDGFYYACINKH
jgi:16S rRNA (cytosine967-C5)-methyltransferase